MALVETEAVILKSFALAEADKIVIFLTGTQGLVRGVAKGAKRLKSRFGGGLEPFSIVDLIYYQKEERELVSISQIEIKKSFFEAASNPFFLQKFAYLAELLIDFAPPHEPNEKLFRMLKVCLETAAAYPQSLKAVGFYCEIWLLKLAGFLPNWNQCDVCKRKLSESETAGVQANFQLTCQICRKNRQGWLISAQEREVFLTALKLSPQKFAAFAELKDEAIKEVSAVLKKIISQILGKQSVGEKALVFADK